MKCIWKRQGRKREKHCRLPNTTHCTVLFLPQYSSFSAPFIDSSTSWSSSVRMTQGSGLQLLSTITLTPLAILSSLIALNNRQLLNPSLHSSLDLSLRLSSHIQLFTWYLHLGYRIHIWDLTYLKPNASKFSLSATFLIPADGKFILNFNCSIQYLGFSCHSSLSYILSKPSANP